MFRRNHKSVLSLLTLALALGPAAAPLAAQQTAKRAQDAPQFIGSMFGGDKKKDEAAKNSPEVKADAAGESREAEAAPSPVSYMRVVTKMSPGSVDVAQTSTTQQPAPSSNNPPAQSGAPVQGPQTASPTQSQTQQSTNPAAPAQAPQPAQPGVPQTAPASPAAPGDASLPAPQAPAGRPAGTQQQPGAPGGQVQPPAGPPAPGRESVPTTPADTRLNVPQVAPDFRADEGPFPALERVGVDMSEQRALSVREVIELALANNKDIEVARENVRAAEFDLQAARGVYDPRFLTNSYYERTEQPTASFLSGSSTGSVTQSGFFSSSSVQGLTPKFGGGYRVDFINNRITTNNVFAALNPQYPTALTFSYTQPLLRGLRFDPNRRLIEIGKKNLSLTDAQFRQRAVETITAVQRAYWDLVYTLRNLQIQREAVRDARRQLEHNRRLVGEGLLAPIDVVAAEAQVSGFEQSVYSALDDVGRAENNLKNLVAENREAPIWRVAIVPTDSVDLAPPLVSLDEAMQAALKGRPELLSSDVAREINEIEQRFAREQTRPQVDLVASYGLVGLAGTETSQGGVNPLTASERADTPAHQRAVADRRAASPCPSRPCVPIPGNLVGGEGQSLANLAANRYTKLPRGRHHQPAFPQHDGQGAARPHAR